MHASTTPSHPSRTWRRAVAMAVCLTVAMVLAAGCGGSSGKRVSGASAGGGGSASSTLTGAGSTFQEPLVSRWSGDFHKQYTKISVNYQGVGSGAGIQQFTSKTVDFGATDAPMKPAELAAARKAGGEVVHVPVALGAVVATYNVKGVDNLRLDGPTLAAIFLGKVTRWNDPAIAALNAGAALPSTPIAVVHRADSSGTTYAFTGYLSAVSPAWKSGPGQDKQPQWPTGTGASGNDGVAAAVKQQDGAIGYNELSFALQNNMQFAQLKNRHGEWVTASLDSTSKAGEGANVPADLRFSLLDAPGAGAYPVVSPTWQLVWKRPAQAGVGKEKASNIVTWLKWELGPGQATASSLHYAPLPASLRDKAIAAVDSITIG